MRQSVWLPVRFDEKMTNCPSGVQAGVPPSASSKVRRRGLPPDDGTIQRSPIGPPLDWKNAINRPSGEIAGVEVLMNGLLRTFLGLVPSALAIQMPRSPSAPPRPS